MNFLLTDLKERVKQTAKQKGVTLAALEQAIQVSPRSISKWDKMRPSIDKVAAVADILDVSVDYLLGRSQETIVYRPEGYQYLDREGREAVESMIEVLLRKQAEKKSDKVGG